MDITEKIDIILVNELKFKKVIRGGKIKKKIICPKGFKVVGGKCVKMSATERRKRSKATRRSQKKLQAGGKTGKLLRKRAKSMRKRGALIPTQAPPELKT